MRTQILTDEQRKEHKKNWNRNYYGTIGHALSMVRHWQKKADRLILEHDSPIMEQAKQYIDTFAITEDSKVEFFGTVGNYINQLVDTGTARELIKFASNKSKIDEKMFENFISREGIEGTLNE